MSKKTVLAVALCVLTGMVFTTLYKESKVKSIEDQCYSPTEMSFKVQQSFHPKTVTYLTKDQIELLQQISDKHQLQYNFKKSFSADVYDATATNPGILFAFNESGCFKDIGAENAAIHPYLWDLFLKASKDKIIVYNF